MNKILAMMNYKIKFSNISISINDVGYKIIYPEIDPELRHRDIIECIVADNITSSAKIKCYFTLNQLDNTLKFDKKAITNDNEFLNIKTFIENLFLTFKKSNINYGNIGLGYEIEYDGVVKIELSDFIHYIKMINRDLIINSL